MARRWNDPKDPDETLDYTVDWADALGGDTIASSTWTVPTGITRGTDSNTATTATIWISGGSADQNYSLLNRITTAGGRTREQTCTLRVSTK
jgi:hypothetical protein